MSEERAGLCINVNLECHNSVRNSRISAPFLPQSLSGAHYQDSAKSGDIGRSVNVPALRSMTAMQGLLLAEVGDATVELDVCGSSSGFREGQRIVLEHVTPGGGTKPGRSQLPTSLPTNETSLARHGTLLSVGVAPGRNAAELNSLLGNSNARLKPGTAVMPPPGDTVDGRGPIILEQAKSRARVVVDIVLESNVCVQGGYLKGHVKIRIRKRSKNESVVFLAGGKVRVVGFECIPHTDDRHAFYHCAAPLLSIATSSPQLYVAEPDAEGFSEAKEGLHIIPFAMQLPVEGESNAKGVLHVHSGIKVRYIAMVSIKIKDGGTDKRSIAHFYRNCEVWPRLNPSVILAPATRLLQASKSKTLFMGGSGKVRLTATLHRLHWIAGQQCYVQVSVKNDTKKIVKSLTLTLVRTTIIFRPYPHLDALPPNHEYSADPDACQTSTTQKQVAESTLEMGHHGSRGHVSAKGWWTGVGPGEKLLFSHFLLLPPDALSITRGRLLEVEYAIRVSVSAGSLASDVQVVLPIRIINFLSVDPPPSFPSSPVEELLARNSIYGNQYTPAHGRHRSRPVIEGLFAHLDDRDQTSSCSHDDSNDFEENPDFEDLSESMEDDSHFHETDAGADYDAFSGQIVKSMDAELGHLDLDDDSDEAVDYAISSTRIRHECEESTARFADLYFASVQENLCSAVESGGLPNISTVHFSCSASAPQLDTTQRPSQTSRTGSTATDFQQGQPAPGDANPLKKSGRPRGPSSFTMRVQEKLQAIADNRQRVLVAQNQAQFESPQTVPTSEQWSEDVDDRGDIGCSTYSQSTSEVRTETSKSKVNSDGTRSSMDSNIAYERHRFILEARELPIPPLAIVETYTGSGPDNFPAAISGLELRWSDNHGSIRDHKPDQLFPKTTSFVSHQVDGTAQAISNSTTSIERVVPTTGSRLLPKLPVAVITTTESIPTSSDNGSQHANVSTDSLSSQPNLQLPGVSGAVPVSSVKAKIRELEERARAMGGL